MSHPLSQEEIDALCEEITKAIEKNSGLKKSIDESESEYECWHKWELYQGFTDTYWYCTICNEKK